MSVNSRSDNSENMDYIDIPNKEIFEQSELSQIMTYEEFLSSSSTNEEVPISSLAYLMSENEKRELKSYDEDPEAWFKTFEEEIRKLARKMLEEHLLKRDKSQRR